MRMTIFLFYWSVSIIAIFFFKNQFSIVFSKSDLGGGTDFVMKKNLKKPNTLKYPQVLVVMCLKPNSVAALLPPPPYQKCARQLLKAYSRRIGGRAGQSLVSTVQTLSIPTGKIFVYPIFPLKKCYIEEL